MATSGNTSVSVGTGATLKFEWSQTSQSVANNTTTISWTMKLIMSSGYSISSSASKDWSVTVNGTKYSGTNKVGVSAGGTKTLASGSTTITHNSDGTKTFSYSFSQEFAINYNGSPVGTKSGSGKGTLNTIARASSISGGTGNIGSNTTITISRASSSFTHTLTYSFGSLSGTIATKTTSTSVSWTIPTSFYAQIPNAKSGTGTIKCETFNGSTSIGSKSISFTAKVTGSEPTLNPQAYVADSVTAQLTGSTTKFIKNFTTVTVSTGASARNSATIKSQSITNGSTTINGGSGTISNIQSGTFTFSATDSRGYTTTKILTKTIVDYVSPTIAWNTATINTDGNLTLKVTGKCFNGSFGAVSNTIKVLFQYKASGGSWSSWYTMTVTRNGNDYTATATGTGFDYTKNYIFKAWIGDKFYELGQNGGVYTAEKSVKCSPVFDWGENDFNFNVSYVAINGNDKTLKMGTGSSDVYIYNSKSGKYLQLTDNGLVKWSGNTLYGDHYKQYGTYSLHGDKPNAKIGYNTDDSCVYISNNNNNWLRLKDDGTMTWKGSPVLYNNCPGSFTVPDGSITVGRLDNTTGHGFISRRLESNTQQAAKLMLMGIGSGYAAVVHRNESVGYELSLMTRATGGSSSGVTSGEVVPSATNIANLGTSDRIWKAVYATNGTIQKSDGRYKYILEDVDSGVCYELIKDMNLYGYSTLNKRIDEYASTTEISDELQQSSQEDMNIHMGFVAQEIEDSELAKYLLTKDDLHDEDGNPNGEYIYGVDNYAYTTAVHGALKHEIELRDKQIEELTKQNQELEERLARLEALLLGE